MAYPQKWSRHHSRVRADTDWNRVVDLLTAMSGVHVNATFITDANETATLPSSMRHRVLSGVQIHATRPHAFTHTSGASDEVSLWGEQIRQGFVGLPHIPVMDDAHIPDLETLSYGGPFNVAQIPNGVIEKAGTYVVRSRGADYEGINGLTGVIDYTNASMRDTMQEVLSGLA